MAELSVRRAADRKRMAFSLADALTAAGATCGKEARGTREIAVRVTAHGGASCVVHFDGASSQPGTWVVTWNTKDRRLSALVADPRGLNDFHGCKATRVFHDFGTLCSTLAADIGRFADGTGYEDDAARLASTANTLRIVASKKVCATDAAHLRALADSVERGEVDPASLYWVKSHGAVCGLRLETKTASSFPRSRRRTGACTN